MVYKKINVNILTLIIVVFVSGCYCRNNYDKQKSVVSGIIPLKQPSNSINAHEARYLTSLYADTMLIYVDDVRLRLTPMGDVLDQNGDVYFCLGTKKTIGVLYYIQRGRDFFVFYSYLGNPEGYSTAQRISLDSRTTVWSTNIEGNVLSCPVIFGQFAYVTATGHVGKLILKSGSFDWHFSGLYKEGRYGRFNQIDVLGGSKIQFVAPQPFSFNNDTIIVNDITGEIIRMTL